MADLIGQVNLLASDKGGRKSEAYSGFGPLVKLADGPCAFELRFMCDDFCARGNRMRRPLIAPRPKYAAALRWARSSNCWKINGSSAM